MRNGKKLKPKKKKQLFEFRGFQVYVEEFIVNELSYQRIYPLEVISTIIFDYNQYSRNETTIPIFKEFLELPYQFKRTNIFPRNFISVFK